MALLTADDVLNKKFQPTKFREGYDQDEVDDFLDEVVNTLRVVTAENEELKAKLAAAEARIAELGEGEPVSLAKAEPEPEPEVVESEAVEVAPPVVEAPAPEPKSQPESAASMLALAQRVHDEYVENGRAEGDRIVGEARAEAERLVREAEDDRNRTIGQLEQERALLERKIDELRVFERDYRTRLKSYLEGLLSDVEGRGSASSGLPPAR